MDSSWLVFASKDTRSGSAGRRAVLDVKKALSTNTTQSHHYIRYL